MAVFNLPNGFVVPEFNFQNYNRDEHQAKQNAFIARLKDWCIERIKNSGKKTSDYIGEIIRFPVADGYAIYMVASTSPAQLIHIPFDDAYQYAYAHRLTTADIKQEVDRAKAFEKIWKKM